MNLKNVENKEKNTVELTIEVGAAEFDAAVDKVYKKSRGNINIPGFRKGKAPRKVIEGMYGSGVFYEDAINDLYPVALSEAVKEANLDMVGYPKVELEKADKDGMVFKATVAIRPVAKLGEYKGIQAVKNPVTVTDEDIENELKPFINRATRQMTVEREAQMGDTAVIDFEGFKDGVPFEGGKAEKYSLALGSGSFIPGFEEQIVGMKAGDERDINVTFPEEYTPELAGQAVIFKIKVHEVKESIAPAVDDEFAKDVSEFETLADFKADLAAKLTSRREETAQKAFEDAVMTKVIEGMECEIPDAMVDYEADRMVDDYAARFEGQGIRFADYLQMIGSSLERVRSDAHEAAVRRVQTEVALTAVAAAENFEVTSEDLDGEIARLAKEYDMEEDKVRAVVPVAELEKELKLNRASKLIYDSAVAIAPEEEKSAEEEKPAKKTRKTTKKAETEADAAEGEEKPKKTTAKKTTRKTKKVEVEEDKAEAPEETAE
jgi:trigger factor